MTLAALVSLARPHQWLKNGFVGLGFVFGRQWSPELAISVAWVFLAFCLASSGVYALNDIVDVDKDRAHPRKRLRAVASDAVSVAQAGLFAVALLGTSLALAWAVEPRAAVCLVAYLLLNVAYSLLLKHRVVVDVFAISAGFMLRILAGSWGLGIPPSTWMLSCAFMLTLFLGFAKRRAELAQSSGDSRPVLAHYSMAMLDQFTAITATCAVLCYTTYTLSPDTLAAHGGRSLAATVPIVSFGMLRYLALLHARPAMAEDVARALLTDRLLGLTVIAWLITAWLLLA